MNKIKIVLIVLFISLKTNAFGQLIPFNEKNIWGYKTAKLKWKIKPQYQHCFPFTPQKVAFVQKDSLFYLINQNNKVLAGPFLKFYPFQNQVAVVQNKDSNYFLINSKGVKMGKEYQELYPFHDGSAYFRNNTKFGVIDFKEKILIPPVLDSFYQFYSNGFVLGAIKGKYSYIYQNGSSLNLPDTVYPATGFSEGYAAVYVYNTYSRLNKLAFIDTTGKIILNKIINDGFDYAEYAQIFQPFKDGRAIIRAYNKMAYEYYFLDIKGEISEPFSSAFQIGEGLFVATIGYYMPDTRIINEKYYVEGKFVNSPIEIGSYSDGLLAIKNKNNKWGFCNKNTQTIIEAQFDEVTIFENGFCLVKLNEIYFYIDTLGNKYYGF